MMTHCLCSDSNDSSIFPNTSSSSFLLLRDSQSDVLDGFYMLSLVFVLMLLMLSLLFGVYHGNGHCRLSFVRLTWIIRRIIFNNGASSEIK